MLFSIYSPMKPQPPEKACAPRLCLQDDVRKGALIMGASVFLYGIVQVPAFLGFSQSSQVGATAGSTAWPRSTLPATVGHLWQPCYTTPAEPPPPEFPVSTCPAL